MPERGALNVLPVQVDDHAADRAAVEIHQPQTFQDVLDLLGFEIQFNGFVVCDNAVMLEIADAAGEQDDSLYRHVDFFERRVLGGGNGRPAHQRD